MGGGDAMGGRSEEGGEKNGLLLREDDPLANGVAAEEE